jgi:hypothetical protein
MRIFCHGRLIEVTCSNNLVISGAANLLRRLPATRFRRPSRREQQRDPAAQLDNRATLGQIQLSNVWDISLFQGQLDRINMRLELVDGPTLHS